MSQHDMNIANQGFPSFRSDLNSALAALVSNSSGSSEPSTTFAHQLWVDTTGNPDTLKIRNAGNDAWITIGSIDQTGDTFILRPAAGSVSVPAYSTAGDTNTGIYFPAADTIAFTEGGVERARLDSSGNLLVAKTSQDTSVDGVELRASKLIAVTRTDANPGYFRRNGTDGDLIQFVKDGAAVGSIAVSSSGASIFLGGTAAANALDDYEEGTWTPEVADATTGGNTASGIFVGFYTKIGRVVTLNFSCSNINTTGMTSANSMYIRNLPFAAISSADLASLNGTVYANQLTLTASEITMVFDVSDGEAYGQLRTMISGSTAGLITVGDVVSGQTDLRISITYTT